MSSLGYMIKGVNDKLQGYHDFQYPKKGEVIAPDWNPELNCEGGIFGCTEGVWGYGFTNHSRFLVLSFEKGTEVKIDSDKIKVPRAKVLKSFDNLQKAIAFFEQKSGLIYCGHKATQTAGSRSTQTAGDYSTQTAGDYSTQTAGDESTQAAGQNSTAILHGRIGYCQHTGKVLQVVWYEGECFTELRVWDGKKYKLEVIDNKLTVEECL